MNNESIINEEWREVPGWDGRYSVSNLGRVRTNYVDYNNHTGILVRKKVENIRVPTVHPKGYFYISLSAPKKRWFVGVHKLIALAFIANPNNYTIINHKNGQKTDNRIENLEWCSHKQNMHHAWRTGLMKNARLTGVKHHRARLCDDDIRFIRKLITDFSDIAKKREIATLYHISIYTINDILKRRSWKHVI